MEKARVLKLEEAITYNQKVIWLELRETEGVVPVTYHSEQRPFLRFDREDLVEMISVRGEYYGKTWRCWSAAPNGQKVPNWKD